MASVTEFNFKNYEYGMQIPCDYCETIDLSATESEKAETLTHLAERVADFYGTFLNPMWHQENQVINTMRVKKDTFYPADKFVASFKEKLFRELSKDLSNDNYDKTLYTVLGPAYELGEIFQSVNFPKAEEVKFLFPLIANLNIKRSPQSVELKWFAEKRIIPQFV